MSDRVAVSRTAQLCSSFMNKRQAGHGEKGRSSLHLGGRSKTAVLQTIRAGTRLMEHLPQCCGFHVQYCMTGHGWVNSDTSALEWRQEHQEFSVLQQHGEFEDSPGLKEILSSFYNSMAFFSF